MTPPAVLMVVFPSDSSCQVTACDLGRLARIYRIVRLIFVSTSTVQFIQRSLHIACTVYTFVQLENRLYSLKIDYTVYILKVQFANRLYSIYIVCTV